MSSDDTSLQRYTGQVKWFNNKAGYGFITVLNNNQKGCRYRHVEIRKKGGALKKSILS